MLCVEELQVFSSTIEVLLLAPALYLVSQARPTTGGVYGIKTASRLLRLYGHNTVC